MSTTGSYTIEEMERWSNDPRTRSLSNNNHRYVQDFVEIRLKLQRVLKAIDEGLTEADVDLAIRTVVEEREVASALRRERDAAITILKSNNYTSGEVNEVVRSTPTTDLVALAFNIRKTAQTMEEVVDNVREALELEDTHYLVIADQAANMKREMTEMAASRDRAVEASNADLEKRRAAEAELTAEREAHAEAKRTLETVSHNLQWLNDEYKVLEARLRLLEEVANAAMVVQSDLVIANLWKYNRVHVAGWMYHIARLDKALSTLDRPAEGANRAKAE